MSSADAAALAGLAERARSRGRIGLDTEFVSEGRYRALLCLVQLVVEGEDGPEIAVVDALAGEGPGPIGPVLADPAVEVVLHAGRQDIPLVRRVWGVESRNLFDTQIAAAFVGASVQPSYEVLLGQFLRIPVSKSATFTRWDRRPLTAEQVAYARADVEHLLPLAGALRGRLEERGRLEWAREESRPLEQASDERDPDEIFRRLPRVTDLNEQAAAVALELTRWRERIAEAEDRHVRWILPDPAIVEVARRQPTKLGQLGDIRGVKGSSLRRLGPDILDAVRRGREAPAVKLDRVRPDVPPDEAGALVALAESLLRARAHEAELAYGLIAARAELLEVVTSVLAGRDEPRVPVLAGWRRDLVGAELLELLRGRRSVTVGARGLLRSEPV
ncbi:MAG: ribonuclease D [Solirubrobacterales bacterium]